MIVIATGNDNLDQAVKNIIPDSMIVNYREFLIKQKYEVIIISQRLAGETEMERLLFFLKKNNSKVIYITSEGNIKDIKLCIQVGIYDILFDPITPDDIKRAIENPKTFSDIDKLYVKYVNEENIEPDKVKIRLGDLLESSKQEDKKTETKTVIKTVVKIEEKKIIVNKIPEDYRKMIGITGIKNSGKTFVSLMCGYYLALNKNKVSVLDLTDNQDSLNYFDEYEKEGLIDLSKNMKLYLGSEKHIKENNIDEIYQNSNVTILDFDLIEQNNDIIRFMDKIYIVTDQDVTNSREICNIVKYLKGLHISESKLSLIYNKVLLNKYIKDINYINRYEKDKNGEYKEAYGELKSFIINLIYNPVEYDYVYNFNLKECMNISKLNQQIADIAMDMYKFQIKNNENHRFIIKLFRKGEKNE